MLEDRDRVERLLDLAEKAEKQGDAATAVDLLKRAAQLAPFNLQIREKLEELLEKAGDSQTRAPDAEAPLRARIGSEKETNPVELADRQEKRGVPLHGLLDGEESTVWREEKPLAAHARAPENLTLSSGDRESAEPERSASAWTKLPEGANRIVTPEKQGEALPKASGSMPSASETRDRVAENETRQGGARASGRRRGPLGSAPKQQSRLEPPGDRNDLFGAIPDAPPSAKMLFSGVRYLSPSARTALILYSTIGFFVLTASIVTQRKFFSPRPGEPSLERVTSASPSSPRGRDKTTDSRPPQTASASEESRILQLAKDYVVQKRYEDAVKLLASCLERGTVSSELQSTFQEELAKAYDQLGTSLLERNKLLQAVGAYEKAVQYAPRNTAYLLRLANARYYCGTLLNSPDSTTALEQAEKEVARVLDNEPRNLDAYQLQAAIRERLRNVKGALAAYAKIIELAPPTSPDAKKARERIQVLSQAR